MRHWLLALMIALLPIRGWMSDAMAVAMLAPPAHTMNQAGTPDAAPCPDHAMASDATASPDGGVCLSPLGNGFGKSGQIVAYLQGDGVFAPIPPQLTF